MDREAGDANIEYFSASAILQEYVSRIPTFVRTFQPIPSAVKWEQVRTLRPLSQSSGQLKNGLFLARFCSFHLANCFIISELNLPSGLRIARFSLCPRIGRLLDRVAV